MIYHYCVRLKVIQLQILGNSISLENSLPCPKHSVNFIIAFDNNQKLLKINFLKNLWVQNPQHFRVTLNGLV